MNLLAGKVAVSRGDRATIRFAAGATITAPRDPGSLHVEDEVTVGQRPEALTIGLSERQSFAISQLGDDLFSRHQPRVGTCRCDAP